MGILEASVSKDKESAVSVEGLVLSAQEAGLGNLCVQRRKFV